MEKENTRKCILFFYAIESSCKGNCALCKKILSLFKEVYCHLLLAIENI